MSYALLLQQCFEDSTFTNPLNASESNIQLRNDTGGKGHFGANRNGGRTHSGIDIAAPLNSELHPTKSGRVIRSLFNAGYGEFIEILHPDHSLSRYAHLSKRVVQKGQWVSKNQLIGYVGKTGNAEGVEILPHLHFEIHIDSSVVDPTKIIMGNK